MGGGATAWWAREGTHAAACSLSANRGLPLTTTNGLRNASLRRYADSILKKQSSTIATIFTGASQHACPRAGRGMASVSTGFPWLGRCKALARKGRYAWAAEISRRHPAPQTRHGPLVACIHHLPSPHRPHERCVVRPCPDTQLCYRRFNRFHLDVRSRGGWQRQGVASLPWWTLCFGCPATYASLPLRNLQSIRAPASPLYAWPHMQAPLLLHG